VNLQSEFIISPSLWVAKMGIIKEKIKISDKNIQKNIKTGYLVGRLSRKTMRYIEIKTSHNIVLRFELASLFQRMVAVVIDIVIVYFYILIVQLISDGETVIFYFIGLPALLVYNLLFELFNNGQTIGKRILGIRVISLDGKPLSPRQIIIRWAFRLVDVGATFGLLAIISIFSSEKSQRIGDLLAHTTVTTIKGSRLTMLNKLIRLDKIQYEVTYPGVVIYNDEDMILVKDVLLRLKKKKNFETLQISKSLASKIKKDLNLEKNQHESDLKFLSTIVDDYVMLTR